MNHIIHRQTEVSLEGLFRLPVKADQKVRSYGISRTGRDTNVNTTTMKANINCFKNGGADIIADVMYFDDSDGSYIEPANIPVPKIGVTSMSKLLDSATTAILAHAVANSYTMTALDIIYPYPIAFSSGTEKPGDYPYISSAAVAGGAGVVRFYLTTDGTSSGAAIFSEIDADSVQVQVWNSTNSYIPASVTVDTNKKYIDVTMKQLTFTSGLAGILNVLTGASLVSAPNGTTVKCVVFGK